MSGKDITDGGAATDVAAFVERLRNLPSATCQPERAAA